MRNAEFGSFINWVFADTKEVCQGAEDVLYNAKGENISKAVRPEIEADVHSKEVVAWWKEMKAGNGPVYANMPENYIMNVASEAFHSDAAAVRPLATAFWNRTIGKAMAATKKPGPMQEVMPGFIGEQSCVQGRPPDGDDPARSLRDRRHERRRLGVGWGGTGAARPHAWRRADERALVGHARRGGGGACGRRYRRPGSSTPHQVAELKARMFAPLRRSGGVEAPELIRAVQQVMAPVRYSIYKRQERLEEALGKVLAIKARLPGCTPKTRTTSRPATRWPRWSCAPRSSSGRRWSGRSPGAGTCARTTPTATTRTGSSGSS